MTAAELMKQAQANGLTATVGPAMRIPGVELVKRRPPGVTTAAGVRWSASLTIPCRVLSEANRRDSWPVEKRRKDKQRAAVDAALLAVGWWNGWTPRVPCVVTLTHIGPRMDEGDNLPRAFKVIRDRLAGFLLRLDDGDAAVTWMYSQRSGPPGVELRIESTGGK